MIIANIHFGFACVTVGKVCARAAGVGCRGFDRGGVRGDQSKSLGRAKTTGWEKPPLGSSSMSTYCIHGLCSVPQLFAQFQTRSLSPKLFCHVASHAAKSRAQRYSHITSVSA
jgi:hypothetical protein